MTKHDFFELVTRTDVDIVQPDLMNTGGITAGKKIAGLAKADHVSVEPHNPQGQVATAIYRRSRASASGLVPEVLHAHFCASVPK